MHKDASSPELRCPWSHLGWLLGRARDRIAGDGTSQCAGNCMSRTSNSSSPPFRRTRPHYTVGLLLLSRVLSRPGGFNIEEKTRCERRMTRCVHQKIRRLEHPKQGITGRGSKINEIFVGGCGRNSGYQRERTGAANQNIQSRSEERRVGE